MHGPILPCTFAIYKKRVVDEMQSDSEDDLSSSYTDAPAVTMDMHITESNVGYRMLQKMGWKAGQGLGAFSQGKKQKSLFLTWKRCSQFFECNYSVTRQSGSNSN